MNDAIEVFDALVIGAGFGGLGAALALAEGGARVWIGETLRYPGGCASTFRRGGTTYDAGATLMSGLGDTQLFGRWLARYGEGVHVAWIDPLVELRAEDLVLRLGRDRAGLVAALSAMPGAPARGIASFLAEQARVAAILWPVFDDPSLLPPFDLRALGRHAGRAFGYASLLPLLGRPLLARMQAHGVDGFAPLRTYVDALCQITVQCPAAEAEAPFAMAALDYLHRGTAHVRGGVGELAWALWRGVQAAGGEVRASTRVTALHYDAAERVWTAETRHGRVHARAVIANLLPEALARLLPASLPLREATRALGRAASEGWGAAMIYAVAHTPAGAREGAHHLELVADAAAPFTDGNHLFVSIGEPEPGGSARRGEIVRKLTISTHVPLARTGSHADDVPAYVAGVHARMRETLALRASEWSNALVSSMTASPRTFERFTGRPGGAVGGIPRRAGLHHYTSLGPHAAGPGLWLVGDTVFPGQSTLATALGGVRTAEAVRRSTASRSPAA